MIPQLLRPFFLLSGLSRPADQNDYLLIARIALITRITDRLPVIQPLDGEHEKMIPRQALPMLALSFVFGLAVLFLLAPHSVEASKDRKSAKAVVEMFHQGLLDTMKAGGTLGVKERFQRLSPIIDEAFLLDLTLRGATGRAAWRKGAPQEKAALSAAFRDWTIGNYAANFKKFDGHSFQTIKVSPGPRKGSELVETRLFSPNARPVTFTYLMIEGKEGWGIYDVLIKRGSATISQLSKQKSEFKNPVSQGLDALTALLRDGTNTALTE